MYDILINGELYHHGVKGMKWGIRRRVNSNGTLNDKGKKKYKQYNAKAKKYATRAYDDYRTITYGETHKDPAYSLVADQLQKSYEKNVNKAKKYVSKMNELKYNDLMNKKVPEEAKKWVNQIDFKRAVNY